MATRAANKRLVREYKAITENPPPYIQAHPSESNILEWHYIITGPEKTPYENGQYWGTLVFPADYPFKPPAIRMMTPSGRFQTSTRLCLSISDFHPKSFNPAWQVSTILMGLLSFMTGDEMTTGSISATDQERRILAARSRWWNSTGGGSGVLDPASGIVVPNRAPGAGIGTGGSRGGVGNGDFGRKFRGEWKDVDAENWRWLKAKNFNLASGLISAPLSASARPPAGSGVAGAAGTDTEGARRRQRSGSIGNTGTAGAAGVVVRRGGGWFERHRVLVGIVFLIVWALLARSLE
ncbi:ubiquitin-conjugating enzyme/RWD-like protein [Tuber indicum]|nr:ubiquitin-conjugating enzyme/RWD-like protein [Tuber indicum]